LNFIFLPPLQRLGILFALIIFLNIESSFVNETCVASSFQAMTLNKKSSKFYSISIGNNIMKVNIMKHEPSPTNSLQTLQAFVAGSNMIANMLCTFVTKKVL
jgi:hypothetical protein